MLTAPSSTLDTRRDDFVWPEGRYEAILEEVRTKDIPTNNDGDPFAGYVTATGTVLGLQFGSMTPLENDADVGDRKFFVDITLSDGDLTLGDMDLEARDVPYWQLQRSARDVLRFARATGHAVEENGNISVPDEFVEELANGGFEGVTVGVEIYHSKESAAKFKRRKMDDPNAERRVYANLGGFFPVE